MPPRKPLRPPEVTDHVDQGIAAVVDEVPARVQEIKVQEATTEDPENKWPSDLSGVANYADLKAAGAATDWVWPKWLARMVATLIGADAGVGKTRFVADLMRRVRHGLPWPDGHKATLPTDSKWLWMLADDNHAELMEMIEAWKMGDVFYMPTPKDDPYGGTQLDGHTDRLRHYLTLVRPAVMVVDTVGSATAYRMNQQDEAEKLFKPLRRLAIDFKLVLLVLTHLNAQGGILGRRAVEKARQVLTITLPDPEGQPNRRRLWVTKSNALKPPALGVTMSDKGCEFDNQPPEAPASEPGVGRVQQVTPRQAVREFIFLQVAKGTGDLRPTKLKQAAVAAGHTAATYDRALEDLRTEKKIEKGEDGRLVLVLKQESHAEPRGELFE